MADQAEAKPIPWLLLSVLGWLIHLVLAAGIWARATTIGPRYQETYTSYQMHLPALSQTVLDLTGGDGDPRSLFWLGMFALVDLVMLAVLARWERSWWKWWFGAVAILLLLLWPVVELALYLPMVKLREALSRSLPP